MINHVAFYMPKYLVIIMYTNTLRTTPAFEV